MELDDLLKQSVAAQGAGGGGLTASPPTSLPSRKPPAPYIPPPRHDSGPNKGIGQVSYKHDQIIDFIIANPGISQNEIARKFDYSVSWISQMISSDAFQVRLAERSGDLIDPLLRDRDAMFKSLVDRSWEVLHDKMSMPSNTISDQLAMRVLEVSSRAIGYGARDPSTMIVQNNTNSIEVHLEKMGEGLTKLLRKTRAVVSTQEAEE